MRKYFSTHNITQMTSTMRSNQNVRKMECRPPCLIEGQAILNLTSGDVFYNRVQEFNRDLSIAVLNVFVKDFRQQKLLEIRKQRSGSGSNESLIEEDTKVEIKILEALSASGLRSIRYAKEVEDVTKIIANDISKHAVETIENNVINNAVNDIVEASHSDAIMLMYNNKDKKKRFTAIDLDPYGSPTIFLDAAVQSVDDGGLLLVTATDMAVLAGNAPTSCHSKYGSISLRTKSCHEMALRILLQCIEAHANKYNRYIVPLLSVSADFYIRVFVKVFTGAAQCASTTSKLSMVYHCVGCGTLTLQPLGAFKPNPKNPNQMKSFLPPAPPVGEFCENCNSRHQMGGPIWSAPIHDISFVLRVGKLVHDFSHKFSTSKRLKGVLAVVSEELIDVPLFYTIDKLCSTMHSQMVPMLAFRSAILNAGYRVSFSHANKLSVKTDAPMKFVWDIMRTWITAHQPIKAEKVDVHALLKYILDQPITFEVNFTDHDNANPYSRMKKHTRYQVNPTPNWGPGSRSTINTGQSIVKSKRNQNKRKGNYNTSQQKRVLSSPEGDEACKKRPNIEQKLIIETTVPEPDWDAVSDTSTSAADTSNENEPDANDTVQPDVDTDTVSESTNPTNQP